MATVEDRIRQAVAEGHLAKYTARNETEKLFNGEYRTVTHIIQIDGYRYGFKEIPDTTALSPINVSERKLNEAIDEIYRRAETEGWWPVDKKPE